MKPYRLRHNPTGLFYQPIKGGNNLSKTGKIYQSSTHGLSNAMRGHKDRLIDTVGFFGVYADATSVVYKLSKDILEWKPVGYFSREGMRAETKLSDWELVEL